MSTEMDSPFGFYRIIKAKRPNKGFFDTDSQNEGAGVMEQFSLLRCVVVHDSLHRLNRLLIGDGKSRFSA